MAARLVIQAAALGETGQVFVLDMGEPVKIAELARQLIQLAGYSTDEIAITYSGLRPGEKLYEELLADADATAPTRIERLRIARLDVQQGPVEALLEWLGTSQPPPTDAEVMRQLVRVVPDYRASGPESARRAPGAVSR